ncbi:hypothetical protein ACMYYO_13620 [Dermacoccaceae bacterium W4C1]
MRAFTIAKFVIGGACLLGLNLLIAQQPSGVGWKILSIILLGGALLFFGWAILDRFRDFSAHDKKQDEHRASDPDHQSE